MAKEIILEVKSDLSKHRLYTWSNEYHELPKTSAIWCFLDSKGIDTSGWYFDREALTVINKLDNNK